MIGIAILGLAFFEPAKPNAGGVPVTVAGELYARIGLAIFGVLLTENLFRNTAPEFRWHIKLLCIAIGGFFFSIEISYVLAFVFFIVLMFVRPRGILAR